MDDPKVRAFVEEQEKLCKRYNDQHKVFVTEGRKYLHINVDTQSPCGRPSYIGRIDKKTLDVYSQSGKKPRGNINNQYGGFDLIDMYGVIVNDEKYRKRLSELGF